MTQRGNRRRKAFFCDDDYRYYIELLSVSAQQANTEIRAYCLIPNRVHLVMVPDQEDRLRVALGEANRHYTRHIKFRQKWRGRLSQERFHSFLMDEDYLLATVRYVEMDPVAAWLCESAGQWPWPSARAHLRGQDDDLVRAEPCVNASVTGGPIWRCIWRRTSKTIRRIRYGAILEPVARRAQPSLSTTSSK